MEGQRDTPSAAIGRLRAEREANPNPPLKFPRKLPLSAIHTEPEVFQHRDKHPAYRWRFEYDLHELQSAIRREPTRRLDPITVWYCGGRWIVIDGHYRIEAYARYAAEQGTPLKDFAVPCEVFHGDFYTAFDFSATANKKVTTPLTSTERSNVTWKRVCLSYVDGKWITSKSQILALGLSKENTISRMRRALVTIVDKNLTDGGDPMGITWSEATDLVEDKTSSDYEALLVDEHPMVQVWADRLSKAFAKEPLEASEVFFLALERYSPKLMEQLEEYLRVQDEEF